jgi:hypothetical protein
MKHFPGLWSRTLLIALGALTAAAAFPPRVQAEIVYPWCVNYGGRGGGRNCGFVTFQQCLATAHGAGGVCVQNPLYQATPGGPGPRKRYWSYY